MADYYVSASYGTGGGTGAIDDPFDDLSLAQAAVDGGDTIHVGNTTAQVAADGAWNATPSPAFSLDAPLTIAGEVDQAGGGDNFTGVAAVADIDGNASQANIFQTTNMPGFIIFRDLYMHNTTGIVLNCSAVVAGLLRCSLSDDAGASIMLNLGDRSVVIGCRLFNISAVGINMGHWCRVFDTVVDGAAIIGITVSGVNAVIVNNLVVNCVSNGMNISSLYTYTSGNTVHQAAGAASGTGLSLAGTAQLGVIQNNIVTGFLFGVLTSTGHNAAIMGPNAFYGNTNNYAGIAGNVLTVVQFDLSAKDIECTASPFTDAAGGDFSVTAEVKAKAWPSPDALYSPADTSDDYSFLGSTTNTFVDMGAAQRA